MQQKLGGKSWTNSSSRSSERTHPANTLISEFWPPELRERIHFCCFKPPSWWYFVPAALETNTPCLLVLLKKEPLNPNILFPSKKDSVPHLAMTVSSKI